MGQSLSSLTSRYLQWCQLRYRPATVALYTHYLGRFAEKIGDIDADTIQRLDLECWSVKKHPLEVIRSFFRWSYSSGLTMADPSKGLKVPKSGRRTRILTRRERVVLRRLAGPELRALLVLLEETAARPHEARALTWDHLQALPGRDPAPTAGHDGNTFFQLSRFKGQTRRSDPNFQRIIPVSPRLGRLLRRRHRQVGRCGIHGCIFHSPLRSHWSKEGLRMAFRRLVDRAAQVGHVERRGLCPYVYRHTKATELANKGINVRILADVLGHASLDLLSWYVHPRIEDLCRALQ